MKRALLLLGWMLGAVTQAADEIEPLDGDFLEYLANMEDEDDDWTLLEDAPRNTADGEQAKKAEVRKPSKEAAKPAVDER